MAKKKVFQIGEALASGLEETISAAQSYSGELRVEIIPIKKIEVDPDNPRNLAITFDDVHQGISESDVYYIQKLKELESLQSIAKSIKEQGIINPVIVYKFGEKYRLVAGERRSLASILAGKSEIQAKILDSKPSELKISLLQWIENIERADLSLWERLINVDKIVNAYAKTKVIPFHQVTITELSQLIGCVKSHAINYKAALNASDDIKALILENKIKNLEKVALLSNIESVEIRGHAVRACLAGATLKKLKAIADQGILKANDTRPRIIEKRGKQTKAIHFGATKNINVAKFILKSVLNDNSLSHVATHFNNIDWNDFRSVANTFQKLLKKLEELYV